MGVDYFDCEGCGESTSDCDCWHPCSNCGNAFCCDCFDYSKIKFLDSDTEAYQIAEVQACPVCSLRIVTDADLLKWALKKIGYTRAKAEGEFRKTRNAKRRGKR